MGQNDADRDVDLVAHDEAAAIEILIPVKAKVLAIHDAVADEDTRRGRTFGGVFLLFAHGEGQPARHVANGEVAS